MEGGCLSFCRLCFASPLIRAACTSKYREAKCGGEQDTERQKRCDQVLIQVQAPGGRGKEEDGYGWIWILDMEHVTSTNKGQPVLRYYEVRLPGCWLLFLSSSFFLVVFLCSFSSPGGLSLLLVFRGGFDLGFPFFSRLRQMQRPTHRMLGDERRRRRSTLG